MCNKTPNSVNGWIVAFVKFFLSEFFFGIKISQGSRPIVVFVDYSQSLVLIAAPAMISGADGIISFEFNIILKYIAHFISVSEKRKNDIAHPVFYTQARENISLMVNVDIVLPR
jgi:hypothetical protein